MSADDFPVSVLLTSLPLDFEPAVRQTAALGFTHVDVVALADRPASHGEALAETGVLVACASVGRGLPEGQTLDAAEVGARRAAVEGMKRQLADASQLGATHAYVVAGHDGSAAGLARFAEACGLLADYAARRMVRLCVEPVPGRALASAAAALSWLDEVGHAHLSLLLDVGHCLISGEEPAQVVVDAGARLGYVHLDDNDGVADLHWPLLTGRLREGQLRALLAELRRTGYAAALTLELAPCSADPVAALRAGRELVRRAAAHPTASGAASARGGRGPTAG